MSSRSSMDRASVWCLGGHGFRFLSRTPNFSLSCARVMLINSPSQVCILLHAIGFSSFSGWNKRISFNKITFVINCRNSGRALFLFCFLRNETVLFSVQGWTIYIVICNNPIRVKFIIVNVNTVKIRSSQRNVAFRLKIHKQTTHWTSIRIIIVKKKFILEVERPPNHANCLLLRYFIPMKPVRFVYFNKEMVLFSGSEWFIDIVSRNVISQ